MHIKTAVQVAVEAIVNAPHGYDLDTIESVLTAAREVGVAEMYVALLVEVHDQMVADRY